MVDIGDVTGVYAPEKCEYVGDCIGGGGRGNMAVRCRQY